MKKKIQPRPLARGQIRNYIYLSTICARKRCTRAHRSTIAQAFTSAQKSERMLGQALRPRWALTAICTYVSLPGLFACVSSSAPLLSAMLFRAFSMTCGNPTWALFSPPVLSDECASAERLLGGFSSTLLTARRQMWACLFPVFKDTSHDVMITHISEYELKKKDGRGGGYLFREVPQRGVLCFFYSGIFSTCAFFPLQCVLLPFWQRRGSGVFRVLFQWYLWKYMTHIKRPRPPELKPPGEPPC